jgi:hypothetical protein
MGMKERALELSALGYSVIPGHTIDDTGLCSCRQAMCAAGKHPRLPWTAYQTTRATDDMIRTWWTRWPEANVLIVTGKVSGIVVVDVDPGHGGFDSKVEQPVMVETLSTFTPLSLTGGGGEHYLFAWPGRVIANAASVFPGVDFRGDGGYIVAPGSRHISGRTYEWDTGAHPEDVQPAPLSLAFLAALDSRVRYKPFESPGVPAVKRGKFNMDALLEGKTRVIEGERNEMMTKVVGSFAAGGTPEAQVLDMALAVNRRVFDPPPDHLNAGGMPEEEVEAIVRNIVNRERRKAAAAAATDELIRDGREELHLDDMSPVEQLDQAEALWREVGVSVVTDWYVLLGGDSVTYVLTTPENEITWSTSLTRYTTIREQLIDHGMAIMPEAKKPVTWDRRAWLLRKLAREEIIEATLASERVDEWFAEFTNTYPPVECKDVERRDYLPSQAIIHDGNVWLLAKALLRTARRDDETLDIRGLAKMLKRAGWIRSSIADGNGGGIGAWKRKWNGRAQ